MKLLKQIKSPLQMLMAVAVFAGMVGLSSCRTHTQQGALHGALLGGAAGALIDGGEGAAVGAAGGAAVGAAIGSEKDRRYGPRY